MAGLLTRSSLLVRVRDPADQESWREFVRLYEPLLNAYVGRLGVPPSDIADVVQEIFVSLVDALPTFELSRSRGRFRTWLWRVARNATTDWARRRRSRSRVERDSYDMSEDRWDQADEEPDEALLVAHHQRVIAHVLIRVRAETRGRTWSCFQEHLLGGRPAAEVARELGISANAVFINASRVLEKVRLRCWEHDEELHEESGPVSDESARPC